MMMRIYLVHTSTGCTGLSNRVLMSTECTGCTGALKTVLRGVTWVISHFYYFLQRQKCHKENYHVGS